MKPEWQAAAASGGWLDHLFNEMHRESPSQVLQRERETFDRMAAPLQRAVVLFGVGHLGRYVARELRLAGIPALAFADNNPKLWGMLIEGLEVLPPAVAVERYGHTACFLVTIYNGSAVRQQLTRMNCQRVLPFAPFFWKHSAIFIPGSCMNLPHTLLDREQEIRAAYLLLSDDLSRRLFCEQVRWRFLLDYECMSSPQDPTDTYFPADLVLPNDQEVFVDCGAFDGDSLQSFLAHSNCRFRHAYTFEPDPLNVGRLKQFLDTLPREVAAKVSVLPYAVSNENATTGFSNTGTAGSRLAPEIPEGQIECRRIDNELGSAGVTYIKMDIEGAEMDALRGAAAIIGKVTAVLAVCVYHRSEHLWEIPSLIHSLGNGYDLFLRRYAEECWELVCYAVPTNRRRRW